MPILILSNRPCWERRLGKKEYWPKGRSFKGSDLLTATEINKVKFQFEKGQTSTEFKKRNSFNDSPGSLCNSDELSSSSLSLLSST
jgi:hypothetical protein